MRLFFFAAASMAVTSLTFAQPYGIETRAENTTLLIDTLPPDPPGANTMQIVRVFEDASFTAPVLLIESPDDSGRLFVVEQCGRIRAFDPGDPSGTIVTYLDIADRLQAPCGGGGVSAGSEEGLLGLAFAPDFASSGELYVYYSHKRSSSGDQRRSHVSRFTASPPGASTVNGSTEELLLQVPQPYSNHNGGMIQFGPDGMLYIHLGDGGSANDPAERAQNTTDLLGSILRIDVSGPADAGLAYAIPPDNPFVDGGPAGSSTRKEIWAYGLRNPWRGSFDPLTGASVVADVGQNQIEEIDVIRKGENYGWDRYEGTRHNEGDPSTEGLTFPIHEYNRSLGNSITGGYTYYGTEVPSLYGLYIYGDYGSGRIWGLQYNTDLDVVTTGPVQLAQYGFTSSLASFGQDNSGEVYVLDSVRGRIHVLRPATPPPGGDNPVPNRLSELPALLAAGGGVDQTDDGIIPYEPSAKLWTDNAFKERYIALPHFDQAGYRDYGGWDYSEDAVVIKNFLLPLDDRDPAGSLKRVETRILTKQNGGWHAYSYEWNDEETDAVLLTGGKLRPFTITGEDGQPFEYEWQYPSRSECFRCHTSAANVVLGTTTGQLNFDYEYPESGVTDNQLRTLDHISILEDPGLPDVPANLPLIPEHDDPGESIRDRARAYLIANCSHCHQPGGGAPGGIDMRWQTADESMRLIGWEPLNDLGIEGAERIYPGEPELSVLYQRIMSRDPAIQMPPLGTSRVDEDAVELIRQWIIEIGQENPGDLFSVR